MRYWKLGLAVVQVSFAACAYANVVGSDLQNFNATTDGIDYVTVNSSETLEMGYFHLGAMSNYAVNSLPIFESAETAQTRFNSNDSLLTNEFLIGLGLWRNFSIGASFSYLVRQKVDDTSLPHGKFSNPGWTHYRYNAKYRVWSDSNYGVAVVATSTINNIRNNPYLGQKQAPIYSVELVGDTRIGIFDVAANIGYRWRESGGTLPNSAIEPTGDQLIMSAALSYLLPWVDTKLIVEAFGSRPVGRSGSDNTKRQGSSAEGIVGLKYDYSTNLAFHAGAGSEFLNGVSSPDWRAYAGVNWAFGPVFERKYRAAEKVTSREAGEDRYVLHSIQFAFNSDRMVTATKEQMAELVTFFKDLRSFKEITVEGHTDSVGADSYNQVLSQRRAETVRLLLIANFGFDPSKVKAVGYGESRPLADNGNFQGRQRNRRVEIRIRK